MYREAERHRAGAWLPSLSAAPLRGYPADSSARDIVTERRLLASPSVPELFRWRLALVGFAEAVASEQEDLRVLHQAIGDGGGNGGVVEDVASVGERGVSRNQRAAMQAVPCRDDLVEQVGCLLIEGKIA
jgi:hypothetical protein